MNTDYKGSSVIVTGAASGMGKACAQRFLNEGWQVIGIDKIPLSNIKDKDSFCSVAADISHLDVLNHAVEVALKDRPPLRAVVNAAGIFPTSSLDSYNETLYRRIFDVNVLGSLNIARVARPYLQQAGGGNIVFFASVDAFAVSDNQLLYCASKAAVVALTRSIATELAAENIRVNAVAPGWVETEGALAGGRIQQAIASLPLKRAAKPEEIADWVFKLGSELSYITGETLCISGGSLMR